jgi:HNH endonuclease
MDRHFRHSLGGVADMNAKDWLDSTPLAWERNECLMFPYSIGGHGYGQFSARRVSPKPICAHRYICEKVHGAPPDGEWIAAAHSCGNKPCVNPRHLRWATYTENENDKRTHGRMQEGERHRWAKLSEKDVLEIRATTGLHKDIALRFGVTNVTIGDIKRRRSWKHI